MTNIGHFEDRNPQYRISTWYYLCKSSTHSKQCKKYTESFGDNSLTNKPNTEFDQHKENILLKSCCTVNSLEKLRLNFENSLFGSSRKPNLYKLGILNIENYIKCKFHYFEESNQFYKEGSY